MKELSNKGGLQGGLQSLAKRWQARFVAILPLVVFVVFLMLPSVSRTIFFTWVCVPYQEAPNSYVYYMRRDASVICHDDDHSSTVALAVVLVLLWPVGMQLLLFFTLYVNREKLRQGIIPPTTKFLTGGYKKEFFYWETIELFRRVTCTGFVVLIPYESIFFRIMMAFVVSVPILVLTAYLKPFKNPEDTALALVSQTILVFSFVCCGIIRILNSEWLDEEAKLHLFNIQNSNNVYLVLGIICIIFLLMLLGVYSYKLNELFQIRVRSKGSPEAVASSTWILAGALTFGVSTMIGGALMYSMVGGIVGGAFAFPIGAGLGSISFYKCNPAKARKTASNEALDSSSRQNLAPAQSPGCIVLKDVNVSSC